MISGQHRWHEGLAIKRMCIALLLFCIPVIVLADSRSSASVSANILPVQPLIGQISVTPEHITLAKGGHGKFTVTNHSGQTHTISIEVEPTVHGVCRLTYTPRQVTLADKAYQVFRLFYVTEGDKACKASFRIRIRYSDEEDDESVDVDCD